MPNSNNQPQHESQVPSGNPPAYPAEGYAPPMPTPITAPQPGMPSSQPYNPHTATPPLPAPQQPTYRSEKGVPQPTSNEPSVKTHHVSGFMASSTRGGPAPYMQGTSADIGAQYQAELFARCARGDHQWTTKFGLCGIITAIVRLVFAAHSSWTSILIPQFQQCCFPIGLICLFLDTDEECSRCGVRMYP
ncbi:hypothetical protein BDZ97DRAFT_1789819 [Flammula alnicola]|nr:hypothetical protein BDZ97DRAFT_1789819 [Flammula alnicola]